MFSHDDKNNYARTIKVVCTSNLQMNKKLIYSNMYLKSCAANNILCILYDHYL